MNETGQQSKVSALVHVGSGKTRSQMKESRISSGSADSFIRLGDLFDKICLFGWLVGCHLYIRHSQTE